LKINTTCRLWSNTFASQSKSQKRLWDCSFSSLTSAMTPPITNSIVVWATRLNNMVSTKDSLNKTTSWIWLITSMKFARTRSSL
jgi:hypothetical protein